MLYDGFSSGMVVSDLDGTLLQKDRSVSACDFNTLLMLGRQKHIRIIATGRSLFSARKVIPLDFPVDYLIFSSGAGIMDWPGQKLLKYYSMTKAEVKTAFERLHAGGFDFMIHRPIPDNHYFNYYQTGKENPDFTKRCEIYRDFATPGDPSASVMSSACQCVVIEYFSNHCSAYKDLKKDLNSLKVIRTTSPLDGRSTWIEIFPKQVSKALAGAWLAGIHRIDQRNILAVGNDYNDLDLLKWAHLSLVMDSAPEEIKEIFPIVSSGRNCGFTEAVSIWKKLFSR